MNPFLGAAVQRGLLLASASPRRREILERLGFEFEVVPTGVEENGVRCDDHAGFTVLVAGLKADEARRLRPASTIIAADTIVVLGERRLGKPADDAEAISMLRALSGRPHEVITGLAVIGRDGARLTGAERTRVFFRDVTDGEIARYVETGEPFGKAGAYAIQGYAAPFIERIEGCYFNVVGLPVSLLFALLAKLERTSDDFSDH
jgi:septum formation protein